MAASEEYVEFIRDCLSGFSDLRTKKYFGGVAFRSDQLGVDAQFGVILGDVLYFVVDDQSRPKYVDKGMQPFRYDKKDKTVEVRKWFSVPDALFDDQDEMMRWALEALEAAVRLK